MASLLKRNGKWYIRYKTENGRWKVVVGYTDKSLTLKKAEQLEFEAEQIRRGWKHTVDGTFAEHLAAFKRSLVGRSEDYIERTVTKLKAFGFENLGELSSYDATDTVNKVLGTLTASTANHYLTALKTFCRWLLTNNRITKTAILAIKKQTIEAEDYRRAATDKEIKKLLKSLRGKSFGLTAEQRYYLYQTALNTGLRAAELASLFPSDVKADHIKVKATNTKNKKTARQPIAASFSKLIMPWASRQRGKLWPGYWKGKAAEMLAADLKRAGVPVETADGLLDFHALRVTYVTNLVIAGLHPRAVQLLARHSTMELTMRVYAKLKIDSCPISVLNPVSVSVPAGPPEYNLEAP